MTARPHCRHPGACQAKGEQTHCRWCHVNAIKSAAGRKSAAKRWNSVAMLAARRAVSERRLVMLETLTEELGRLPTCAEFATAAGETFDAIRSWAKNNNVTLSKAQHPGRAGRPDVVVPAHQAGRFPPENREPFLRLPPLERTGV